MNLVKTANLVKLMNLVKLVNLFKRHCQVSIVAIIVTVVDHKSDTVVAIQSQCCATASKGSNLKSKMWVPALQTCSGAWNCGS